MEEFDEITVEGKVIPLFMKPDNQLFIPLKNICEALNINIEEEKIRIAENSFIKSVFVDDYCKFVYILGYIGSIGLNETIDLELRREAMKWYNEFYNFTMDYFMEEETL